MNTDTLLAFSRAFPEYLPIDAIDILNPEITMTDDAAPATTAGQTHPHADAATRAAAPAPDYNPVLAMPVVYRDEQGREHAALITNVHEDAEEVGLVVFPDQSHHHHVKAAAVESAGTGAGWFPIDA